MISLISYDVNSCPWLKSLLLSMRYSWLGGFFISGSIWVRSILKFCFPLTFLLTNFSLSSGFWLLLPQKYPSGTRLYNSALKSWSHSHPGETRFGSLTWACVCLPSLGPRVAVSLHPLLGWRHLLPAQENQWLNVKELYELVVKSHYYNLIIWTHH